MFAYLTEIHDNALVYFLPQMGPEDLNEGDLQSGNLAMHEYTGQIELHLKSNIDVSPVDCRRPPQSETTIWNLIQTRSLSVCQLLVLH